MKIATWNVNGVRARRAEVLVWMQEQEPDVLCLQELKAAQEQLPEELCAPSGYHCFWHGQKGYSGVSLHINHKLSAEAPEFFHPEFDHDKRIVAARVRGLTIASVYVPNGGADYEVKLRFLEAMVDYGAKARARGEALILCGDLNVARSDIDVHPKERKVNAIGQRTDERALFDRLLGQGLTDVARTLEPDNDHLFTWWAPWRNLRQRDIGWRIDYILASDEIAGRAKACRAFREFGTSDHGPVVAVFDLD